MPLMRRDEPSTAMGDWSGIEEAFAALESPLLAYALRFTSDRSSAEDLVMEAFMKLHEHYSEVRDPRRWLFRTVHNLALNQKRDGARTVYANQQHPGGEADSEQILDIDTQPLPDEQIARLEGIGLVRVSIEALDERSKELLKLKFTEELSYKEISARTGLSTGNVGYLLHHALKAVADALSRKGVER